ncbi:MAG: TetR/AcrR family transcriptional regulator [Planctomycetota bacterium]
MPRPIRQDLPDLLLLAAAEAFAAQGLHGASLDAIAERLGVTKGAVYFHFRSKLELFHAALDRLEQLKDEVLTEAMAEAQDRPAEALEAMLGARLRFGLAHPELRRLHWILDTELGSEVSGVLKGGVRAEHRRLRAELRTLLQRASRLGQVQMTDPAAEAFRLAAALEGTLSLHQAGPDDVALFLDPEALVRSWLAPIRLRRGRRPAPSESPAEEPGGEDFQPAF